MNLFRREIERTSFEIMVEGMMDNTIEGDPAPNLCLNLNPVAEATVAAAAGKTSAGGGSKQQRPQSAIALRKGHNFVQKDFYRHMKTDKLVEKYLQRKQAMEMGRAPAKSLLEIKNARYRQIGEIISEQYARSQIPEARLYMIDKVVRMRG